MQVNVRTKVAKDAFSAGLAVFTAAIDFQLVAWGFIAILEFVGLGQAQRILLRWAETIYAPAHYVFWMLTPASWQFTGNVLFGLASVAFGILAYSFILGCGTLPVMSLAKWRKE